jgi:hypothetical protein
LCEDNPDYLMKVCGRNMYVIPPGKMRELLGDNTPSQILSDGVKTLCDGTLVPHIFCFELKDPTIREAL